MPKPRLLAEQIRKLNTARLRKLMRELPRASRVTRQLCYGELIRRNTKLTTR